MQVEKSAYAFRLNGSPVSCRALGHGHINATYQITTDTGAVYVLQQINRYVFQHPEQVMANAQAVTAHLRSRVSDPREAICFIPTVGGAYFHKDDAGEYWRMYAFVPGFCLDLPESAEDFYQSALAFGRFQQLLSDFPAKTLYETIPNFHNTADRYRQLRQAIADDPHGRLAHVQNEVDFLLEREALATSLCRMLEDGLLPLRVTHNDTKLNNVLLDPLTRKSLCVLDLDTVMPGLSAHDFGDSIRFGAATAAEDEQELSKMELDLALFRIYTQGFLEAATSLTEQEVQVLPLGALVITLELAARFLTDYLNGDVYFKTAFPSHNLVRARAQMKLAADMQNKQHEMNRIVAEVAASIR